MERLPNESERDVYDRMEAHGAMGLVYEFLECNAEFPLTDDELNKAFNEANARLQQHTETGRDMYVMFQADENVLKLDSYKKSPDILAYARDQAGGDDPSYEMLYGVVDTFSIKEHRDRDGVLHRFLAVDVSDYRTHGLPEKYRVYMAQSGDVRPHRTKVHSVMDEPMIAYEAWFNYEDEEQTDQWTYYQDLLNGIFVEDSDVALTGSELMGEINELRRAGAMTDQEGHDCLDDFVTACNLMLNDPDDLRLDASVTGYVHATNLRGQLGLFLPVVYVQDEQMEVVAFDKSETDDVIAGVLCRNKSSGWMVRASFQQANVLMHRAGEADDEEGWT